MTQKTEFYPHTDENHFNSATSDILAKRQRIQEKLKQHYPMEDKRKIVRQEHTNGSTPSNRL